MNDMSQVIVPRSDQWNADDFLPGPRTFTIAGVDIRPGTEQPVSIHLAGEERVWRPCKSMSRVLVSAWGPDANTYAGRAVTLYRDPKVKWGGMEIGGIRVSHLSHIDREMLLQLTATKGKRAPHIVKPLAAPQPATDQAAEWAGKFIAKVRACTDVAVIDALESSQSAALAKLKAQRPELHTDIEAKIVEQRVFLAPDEPREGKPADGFGDQFDTAPAAEWEP